MRGNAKRTGIMLTAAALAMAVIIAATGAYALAKYTTVFSDLIEGELTFFDVTSEMTYTDEWGTVEPDGTDLGTMRRGRDTIAFTFTAYNHSDVPVSCYLTIDEGYMFSDVTAGNAEVSSDGKTLTIADVMPAATDGNPGTVTVSFTVTTDGTSFSANGTTVSGVYSRNMYITAHYEQAE